MGGRTVYRSNDAAGLSVGAEIAAQSVAEAREFGQVLRCLESWNFSHDTLRDEETTSSAPQYAARIADACLRALREAHLF